MLPSLKNGDYVIASRWYRTAKIGQLLVINHENYGVLIKRVTSLLPNQALELSSDNPEGITSAQIGPVSTQQILGKVLWQVRQ